MAWIPFGQYSKYLYPHLIKTCTDYSLILPSMLVDWVRVYRAYFSIRKSRKDLVTDVITPAIPLYRRSFGDQYRL